MRICVYCSGTTVGPAYERDAVEFTRLIAEKGHTLVWGGSDAGLMGVVADTARQHGAPLVGVALDGWTTHTRFDADHLTIATTLADRKRLLREMSDVFVVMVGGLGVLDELTEIVELRKQGVHDKPVIVLNTLGFYNDLENQLKSMAEEGFLNPPLDGLVEFINTPAWAAHRVERATHSIDTIPTPPERPETVTITREEYESLQHDSDVLGRLENGGVDNWDGYDLALRTDA
jgi:uncharacterized protein (TIGR00730 family)